MFGNTYYGQNVIIINVKTPQYIIYFLLHPIISEIPSPKRTAFPGCPFYYIQENLFNIVKKLINHG